MKRRSVLVTGSSGLIGSESVKRLCSEGYQVVGVDNDLRSYFFGPTASTLWNVELLTKNYPKLYKHESLDIRNKSALQNIFQNYNFEMIIHTAAQPSHDWAAKEPETDFSINATGTLNLLELTREYCRDATFILTSTNKVYGDNPNLLPLTEQEMRFDLDMNHSSWHGIDETMSIDSCTHSIFGVSKTAADLMTQEYGRYFDMNTVVFRGGCLTGPLHSGAELHGFLSYLVKAFAESRVYTIFGYKGKQVRDNIHSKDLIEMFIQFHKNPKPGAIYNAGGGRQNSLSILEAIKKISEICQKNLEVNLKSSNRLGDHKWYITDFSKFRHDYPEWNITFSVDQILEEMISNAFSKQI